MKNALFVLTMIFCFHPNIFSQKELGDGWKLNGQIQLRTELDGRDFSNSTHPLTFASMRTRLGIEKSFEDVVSFFVQFQDSRVFGEEPNTLAPIDNIDLHQGFINLNKLFGWDWLIQAGRFEAAYGTERFIGPVGWHFVGRSFDGARFTIAPGSWDIDLFGLTVKESVSYIGNATPPTYPYPQESTPSSSIYGLWKKSKFDDSNKLDVFGYWEVDREQVRPDTCRLNKISLGGTYWGNFGNFSTIVEGAYQFGKQVGRDVSAYLFSAQGNYQTGIATLGLGADILSGTNQSESDKVNTFYPTYGTNHKFYGYMDYFINVPINTMNLGLNDFYFKGKITPEDSKWGFMLDLHYFMSNQKYTFTENGTENEIITFGQELDLTVIYDLIKGTKLSWGGSLFFPGDLMKYMFDPREDIAYWTYLMVTANL